MRYTLRLHTTASVIATITLGVEAKNVGFVFLIKLPFPRT